MNAARCIHDKVIERIDAVFLLIWNMGAQQCQMSHEWAAVLLNCVQDHFRYQSHRLSLALFRTFCSLFFAV